ncbi:DUF4435 domain-containing protein [Thiotrichales bacterium HSG1]|nr:DUF4435 domain-containing protein [Thiotrichales bacterium HSG1]
MSKLIDNISSDFLETYTINFFPKNQEKTIVVYVEGDADIAFWRMILNRYEKPNNIKFEINLPSKDDLWVKGKKNALSRSSNLLELKERLGKFLLICVDSDYDYLLNSYYMPDDKKRISKKINESIYIFQTYSYSIENLNCFSESLSSICVSATYNDTPKIDFTKFLKSFSTIVYKLFLWNLFFYSKGEDSNFTLSDFCSLIILEYEKKDKLKGIIHFSGIVLKKIRIKVTDKLNQLENKFPSYQGEIERFGEELKSCGLTKENAYLYIQGHTIFKNIVLMLLKPVCNELKKEKESEIKKESKNEINAYLNKVGHLDTKIETLLSNNTNFESCFLFKKIEKDIENYINKEIDL